jgi:hypothetical protein
MFTVIFIVIFFALFLYVFLKACADYNDFIERELDYRQHLDQAHLNQHMKRLETTWEQMNE